MTYDYQDYRGQILGTAIDGKTRKILVDDSGSVLTQLTGRRTAIGGRVTVLTAGTPVSLGTADVGEGVYIVADPANTSAVYVFPAAGVKTDSVPLWPGDSDFWPVSNLSALKIDSIINGDGIYWKAAI